jgi:ribosomal protein S18 acetylase RimI-like enzyme
VTGAHPLDNAVWHALGSHHRHLAERRGRARRYDRNVAIFGAVDRFDPGSWSDLAALLGPSRACALFRSEVPAALPEGWILRARGQGRQMTVDPERLAPITPVEVRQLTTEDVPLMLELVALTNPGPFRPATITMGYYAGHFDQSGGRLIAMAGERMHLTTYCEISAVCTHPDARGRGLASALTYHVAERILARGEQPFLHVADTNEVARRVYEHLGFTERRLVDLAVVEAPAGPDQ